MRVKKKVEQVVHSREKKGGSGEGGEGGEGGNGDDDLFRKWNGYEKGSFWFVLKKTIKWLTPSK